MWRGRKGRAKAAVAYEKREVKRRQIRTRVFDLLTKVQCANKETVQVLVRSGLLKEVHAPRGLPPSTSVQVVKDLKQRLETELKSRIELEKEVIRLKRQWDRDERDRLAEIAKYVVLQSYHFLLFARNYHFNHTCITQFMSSENCSNTNAQSTLEYYEDSDTNARTQGRRRG